jgi:uncharacterized protein YdeI (YjbR/CyaY-like superfamily)
MNPKVDWFFNKAEQWKQEFEALRRICLDCGLNEELKWGHPCYTFKKKNIVLIHGFKKYCALLFHKGALLKDPDGILIQQTKNVRSGRQIRFTNVQQVMEMESTLRAYIHEAIEVEKAGLKVDFKKKPEPIPEELQSKFNEHPALKKAFYELTPGRQRGYILHFSQPKQSKTRASRIEKCMDKIFNGEGLHDRYKK